MNDSFSFLFVNSRRSVLYMMSEITHICRNMKKRDPGSIGEREAAEYLADILAKDCGCSSVKVEKFAVHPDAFYVFFYFVSFLSILCLVFSFVDSLLSLVLGLVTLILFVFHFVLYRPVIDPLFPKRQGTNVTAIRACTEKVKRRIFFNGHIDAAWEFPLNYHFGGVLFEIPGLMAFSGIMYYTILSFCSVAGAGNWTKKAAIAGLIFAPAFVIIAFTYNPMRVVAGANDDLTGCCLGIALLHEMETGNLSLEYTEIGVLLTGSEEAGLRGAKAWSLTHKDDFKDVPTYIVTFDTIHDPRFLMVNKRDLNGIVKSDAALSELFLLAAKKADVPCIVGWVPPFGGATDSAAFTQGGFRSVGITGLNHKLEDYYHTRKDSYHNLNPEGLENCYKALVMLVKNLDNGVLD